MKFGKEIARLCAEQPRHRNFYLNYNELKRAVKNLSGLQAGQPPRNPRGSPRASEESGEAQFAELLRHQLDKVNNFVELQWEVLMGEIKSRLRSHHANTVDALDRLAEEVALLDAFVRTNYTGFRKITKKCDKKHDTTFSVWFMAKVESASFRHRDFDGLLVPLGRLYAQWRDQAAPSTSSSSRAAPPVEPPLRMVGPATTETFLVPLELGMRAKVRLLKFLCPGLPGVGPVPRGTPPERWRARQENVQLCQGSRMQASFDRLTFLQAGDKGEVAGLSATLDEHITFVDEPRTPQPAEEALVLRLQVPSREDGDYRALHDALAGLGLREVQGHSRDLQGLAVLHRELSTAVPQWAPTAIEEDRSSGTGSSVGGSPSASPSSHGEEGAAQGNAAAALSSSATAAGGRGAAAAAAAAAAASAARPSRRSSDAATQTTPEGGAPGQGGRSFGPAAFRSGAAAALARLRQAWRAAEAAAGGAAPDLELKVDPKMLMANERTLLRWLRSSVLLSGLSAMLLAREDEKTQVNGFLVAGVALLFTLWPIWSFRRSSLGYTHASMGASGHGGAAAGGGSLGQPRVDRTMPQALSLFLAFVLAIILVVDMLPPASLVPGDGDLDAG